MKWCVAFPLILFPAYPAFLHAKEAAAWSIREGGQERQFQVAEDQIGTHEKGESWKVEGIRPAVGITAKTIKNARPQVEMALILQEKTSVGVTSLKAAEVLRRMPGVLAADVMLAGNPAKKFIPNDPLFTHGGEPEGYQWHLQNTG